MCKLAWHHGSFVDGDLFVYAFAGIVKVLPDPIAHLTWTVVVVLL